MSNLRLRKTLHFIIILAVGIILTNHLSAQIIKVHTLSIPPTLDGMDKEWNKIPNVEIPLAVSRPGSKSDVTSVSLKAGVFGDEVYFIARWKDDSEDLIHTPFHWNADEQRYIRGTKREDRFSIQFGMEGDYTTNWFSGNEFKADMWHWKSSRTNPLGLAHDKLTIISARKMKHSYKFKALNGEIRYILRPFDEGSDLYTSKRYSKKEADIMPRYILAQNPKGSVIDVKAKGVWNNGNWVLEIKRRLNTGHLDDIIFIKGKLYKGGIAIFNHSIIDDHNISQTLSFQF